MNADERAALIEQLRNIEWECWLEDGADLLVNQAADELERLGELADHPELWQS